MPDGTVGRDSSIGIFSTVQLLPLWSFGGLAPVHHRPTDDVLDTDRPKLAPVERTL